MPHVRKKKLTNVNIARHVMFQQTYAPKSISEPLGAIKGVNPSSLPPCRKVLLKKLKRTHYVAAMWKNASSQKPCTSAPEENGWILDNGKYSIDWYDGDQLPTDIYKALETSANAVLN